MLLHAADGRTKTGLARGAAVNAAGVAAKLIYPLFLVAMTRWYGPAAVGVYLVAWALTDSAVALVTGGLADGIVAFGAPRGARSRGIDDPGSEDAERELHALLGHALRLAAIGCGALMAAGVVGAPALRIVFPQPGVAEATRWLWITSPLYAITPLVIAATRARFMMRYDAVLHGALRPALLVLCAALCRPLGASAASLVAATILAQGALAAVAIAVFVRHFSVRALAAALRAGSRDAALARFVWPQSINLAVQTLVPNIGSLALAARGTAPSLVAFYAAGVTIVINLRQIGLIFTTAFAPAAAALLAERRAAELKHLCAAGIRWSLYTMAPVVLFVAVFCQHLLAIVHPSYTGRATFMLVLLAVPLIYAVSGFFANLIVMAGHSRWNLANSLIEVCIAILLAWSLLPRWRLTGVAAAVATAAAVIGVVQAVEVRKLLRGLTRSAGEPLAPQITQVSADPGRRFGRSD